MDAELKGKWIAALRSGEFKQATGALKRGDAYCCLGVFCVVAKLPISDDGCAVESAKSPVDGYQPIIDHIGEGPKLGILWTKNDTGIPFPEIADWIEDNL